MKKPKRMTLREWIEETGPNEVAELLNVPSVNVRQWKRGYCLPRAEQMRIIKKLTRGRIDYEDMIEPHFKNRDV